MYDMSCSSRSEICNIGKRCALICNGITKNAIKISVLVLMLDF